MSTPPLSACQSQLHMSPLCAHQSREFKEFTLPVKFVRASQRVAVTTRSRPVSSLGTPGAVSWTRRRNVKPDPDHGGPLVRGVCPKLRRRETKTEHTLFWPTREEHGEDPVPLFVTFFFSCFPCVQRVTYFGTVHPDSPLFGRFFFFFSLHRSHFPDPRSAPVSRWFACPRVHMSSAAPSVLSVPPQETVRSWRHWDTLVSSHPTKSSASLLPLSSTAAHKIRALPVRTFQSKTP